jgi:hypothetical protein
MLMHREVTRQETRRFFILHCSLKILTRKRAFWEIGVFDLRFLNLRIFYHIFQRFLNFLRRREEPIPAMGHAVYRG